MKVGIQEVTCYKEPNAQWWENMVRLTQIAFKEGHRPYALTYMEMVLLLKGKGFFRGTGLV